MKILVCSGLLAAGLSLGACAGGGGSRAADTSRYSHRMHSRFYNAWQQPTSVSGRRGKISVPVDVEIDPAGRVTAFALKGKSGDPAVDASIAAVGERIRKVTPPPTRTPFRLRIYFELDVR